MTRTSIFAAAILSASAVALVPMTANASEDDGARVSRNWTGNASAGATHSRKATAAPRNVPADDSGNDDSRSNRDVASDDDDGDNRRYSRRHHDESGLDPAEAARIRRAHAESDGHVYMRRDRDEDGTPSYRSGYSTTYNGNWEAPRPPRRHHWWHAWWN